mmetsp:Transcript_4205/g.4777  ORF Transcript_4205/g.4777 Transcript_4205/m.4777 type:complete len:477 (-) Transcript_4205:1498-2928(-)
MLLDGNNNKSKPIINNNVSCQESSRVDSEQTSTKVASQGSFRKKNEKDNSIVTGNDIDDDDDDDDDIEEQFEDFFSTPPEEFPPQESKKMMVSPNKEYLSKKKESSSPLSSLNLMFPSFVIAGLQQKVSILEIKAWIAMSLSLDGRDKITKVLQYLSRFLAWWFLSKVNSPAYAAAHGHRLTNFFKSLSTSRKAFRLGRSIDELYKLGELLSRHFRQYSRNKDNLSSLLTQNTLGYKNLTSYVAYSSYMSRTLQVISTILTRSISSIPDRMFSFIPISSNTDMPKVELWKATGSGLKMIALVGFYLGDNLNFLTSSGTLDNYSLSETDRLSRRKQLQSLLGKKSNQSYFFASIVGLVMNAYSYHRFVQQRNKTMLTREQVYDKNTNDLDEQKEEVDEDREKYLQSIATKKEQKQFELFLSVLKSCMDVIVFSNNDGIDLHKKWRGRKNHEGLHCLCGLISAGTGLYNQFSDAKISS